MTCDLKSVTIALCAAFSLAGWWMSPLASATVVNVDFNGFNSANLYTGQGALATPDIHFWNDFALGTGGASTTSTPLLASDGTTATGYTVTLNDWLGYDYVAANLNPSGNALIDDIVYNANWATGGAATFSINGLTTGRAYNLYLYGDSGYNGGSSSFTIGATTLSTSGRTSGANASGTPSFWVAGVDYVLFQNVVATGSQITGSWTTTAGFGAAFDGLQIQEAPIPEPATILLLGVGGLWLRPRSRRRK